jgi:hypothetical protein
MKHGKLHGVLHCSLVDRRPRRKDLGDLSSNNSMPKCKPGLLNWKESGRLH